MGKTRILAGRVLFMFMLLVAFWFTTYEGVVGVIGGASIATLGVMFGAVVTYYAMEEDFKKKLVKASDGERQARIDASHEKFRESLLKMVENELSN